jgi:2,4-dienoyl-CoA reductase-like NADH-dependent reductase (Old Yellow Enzyme family)
MEASDADEGGAVSPRTLLRYQHLAEGKWGTVFVEATSVTPTSLGRLRGLVLTEATLASFRELTSGFKKRNPDGLLMVQLTHSGRHSHPGTDRTAVSPGSPPGPRYLSGGEIEQIKHQFVDATLLAEGAGFDGIDLKLCHGYLGTELLRPANTRPDRWGGSLENRTRFMVEAFTEIKSRLQSSSFVLGSRISFYEGTRGGCGTRGPDSRELDPSETLELLRIMDRLELDYVNVSGSGTAAQGVKGLHAEEQRVGTLWYERLTRSFVHREGIGLAVIGTGYTALGQGALTTAARRIVSGHTDLVGFGRQSFADPLLPAKVQNGEPVSYCVLCSSCAELMGSERNAGCVVHSGYYRDQLRELRRSPGT